MDLENDHWHDDDDDDNNDDDDDGDTVDNQCDNSFRTNVLVKSDQNQFFNKNHKGR